MFGTFGTLEGGGNGTSVNLGGGLTLEAFYNNAAGNISLQVVNTPATTAFIWKDATGSWDTAGDWTTGTVPTPVADVTIGNTTTGNVTLSHDATINSLQINASNALTTTGGTLTVGANVTDNGSLTLGGGLNLLGTVTADSGASLSLNNGGAIIDATLAGAGTFQTNAGQSGTLHGVTISNGTTFVGQSGSTTTMNGTIVNNGTLEAAGGAIDATTGFTGTGTAKIDGGGHDVDRRRQHGRDVGAKRHPGARHAQHHGREPTTRNANFGSGNSFDAHAGVTGTGQDQCRRADARTTCRSSPVPMSAMAAPRHRPWRSAMSMSAIRRATRSRTRAPPRTRRCGVRSRPMSTAATSPGSTGTGVTAANFGPIAPGGSSTFTVTANKAGALAGQAIHIANNFDNVRAQTMDVTGNAYAFASPTVTSSLTPQFNFGVVQVGQTYNDPLTHHQHARCLERGLPGRAERELRQPVHELPDDQWRLDHQPRGRRRRQLQHGRQPAPDRHRHGQRHVPINFASNGATTSGLGITPLAGQNLTYNWSFSGSVVNPANPSITPTTIDFGNVRIGTTQQPGALRHQCRRDAAAGEPQCADLGGRAGDFEQWHDHPAVGRQ